MTKKTLAFVNLVFAILATATITTGHAIADTADLYGKTLKCSSSENGYPSALTVYVTKSRVFLYHSYRGTPSKSGVVYEFGRERSGMAGGVNPYQSSARIDASGIELSVTLENRTCRICDGKIIMISDSVQISPQGSEWMATRTFKQWFPDGTGAAVPSGSEHYSCKLSSGRTGVGR